MSSAGSPLNPPKSSVANPKLNPKPMAEAASGSSATCVRRACCAKPQEQGHSRALGFTAIFLGIIFFYFCSYKTQENIKNIIFIMVLRGV